MAEKYSLPHISKAKNKQIKKKYPSYASLTQNGSYLSNYKTFRGNEKIFKK